MTFAQQGIELHAAVVDDYNQTVTLKSGTALLSVIAPEGGATLGVPNAAVEDGAVSFAQAGVLVTVGEL